HFCMQHVCFYSSHDSSLLYAPLPTQFYPLSLHDALPICPADRPSRRSVDRPRAGSAGPASGAPAVPAPARPRRDRSTPPRDRDRSEEHTSELQSHLNLVCRLLLEKKKQQRLQAIS